MNPGRNNRSKQTDHTYECPSPDDCGFVAENPTALLEHVNSEHPGEYKHPDWPDTDAARADGESDSNEE